ncbi:MAG TPA: hypothetical protein VGR71_04985 [Nitrospira sp.]|nr:hypothetical protein [Nitrospira sp.]
MRFDEAAAEWVRRNFRGMDANPIIGTVEFDIDWAAYDSGPRYCNIDVSWKEEHAIPLRRREFSSGMSFIETHKKIVDYHRTLIGNGDSPGDRRGRSDTRELELTEIIREITDIAAGQDGSH